MDGELSTKKSFNRGSTPLSMKAELSAMIICILIRSMLLGSLETSGSLLLCRRSKWLEEFIRDRYVSDTHLTIVLAFALESESCPLGVTFQNRTELENAFSSTPPSLYLFRQGHEFSSRN